MSDSARFSTAPFARFDPTAKSAAEDFQRAAYDGGWIIPFDWATWLQTAEAIVLLRKERAGTLNPHALASADVRTIARLITSLVRGDRFADGTLERCAASGALGNIVERLRQVAIE